MLQYEVLPINPLGPIVHGLYFSSDNVFSIMCMAPEKFDVDEPQAYTTFTSCQNVACSNKIFSSAG